MKFCPVMRVDRVGTREHWETVWTLFFCLLKQKLCDDHDTFLTVFSPSHSLLHDVKTADHVKQMCFDGLDMEFFMSKTAIYDFFLYVVFV